MHIPNDETLFRYAKPEAFPNGQQEIPVSIFTDTNLSCDWKKYRQDPSTSFHIEQGRSIVIAITVCEEIRNPRNPKNNGVIEEAWKQEIIHDPISQEDDPINVENYAHSLIRGKKKAGVTSAIRNNSILF